MSADLEFENLVKLYYGDLYRFGANYGFSPEAAQYALEHPLREGPRAGINVKELMQTSP